MVTIGILQPGYLPWLGFFEQMHRSDIFVIYDDVQFDKHSWRNRNRIKTTNGSQWLTVPVHSDLSEGRPVNEIQIDNRRNWRKKHRLSIQQNYSKALYFREYFPIFDEGYSRSWEWLIDLDMFFILNLAEKLGMETGKVVYSSELDVSGDRQTRLLNICRKYEADVFYEGAAGRNYIDIEFFRSNDVQVVFQDYQHPVYRQLHGEFIPFLSVIDLLFNHGHESLAIITSGMSHQTGV